MSLVKAYRNVVSDTPTGRETWRKLHGLTSTTWTIKKPGVGITTSYRPQDNINLATLPVGTTVKLLSGIDKEHYWAKPSKGKNFAITIYALENLIKNEEWVPAGAGRGAGTRTAAAKLDLGPFKRKVIVMEQDKTYPNAIALVVPGFQKDAIRSYLERKSSTPAWIVAERDFITMGGQLIGKKTKPNGPAQQKAHKLSLSGDTDYSVMYVQPKKSPDEQPPWFGKIGNSTRTANVDAFIQKVERHGEFDALVEQMNGLASQVRDGMDADYAADILKHDFGAELAAGAKIGDVTSKREFKELEDAILGFGKALLGNDAPRKLAYPKQYQQAIKKLSSTRTAKCAGPRCYGVGSTKNLPVSDEQVALSDFNIVVEGPNAAGVSARMARGVQAAADWCQMTPACKGNLGLPRSVMPQIRDEVVPKFIKALKDQGIKVQPKRIPVKNLMATQKEINADKVEGIAAAAKAGKIRIDKEPVLISKENYVLDGHHRWAAALTNNPNQKFPVIQIGMLIRPLLNAANSFEGVGQAGFGEQQMAAHVQRFAETAIGIVTDDVIERSLQQNWRVSRKGEYWDFVVWGRSSTADRWNKMISSGDIQFVADWLSSRGVDPKKVPLKDKANPKQRFVNAIVHTAAGSRPKLKPETVKLMNKVGNNPTSKKLRSKAMKWFPATKDYAMARSYIYTTLTEVNEELGQLVNQGKPITNQVVDTLVEKVGGKNVFPEPLKVIKEHFYAYVPLLKKAS